MNLQELQQTVNALIQAGQFDQVPTLLERDAAKMDKADKEALIPFVEATGLEISYTSTQHLHACRCYELAAELAEQVYGESDDRAIKKLDEAAFQYSVPNCELSNEQGKESVAKAVVLLQRYIDILRKFYPDLKQEIAHKLFVQVFCAFWGDPIEEDEFRRLDAMHQQVIKALIETFGEQSNEFASECKVYGTFLEYNGRVVEGRAFGKRGEEIEAALEGAQ